MECSLLSDPHTRGTITPTDSFKSDQQDSACGQKAFTDTSEDKKTACSLFTFILTVSHLPQEMTISLTNNKHTRTQGGDRR